MFVVGLWYRDEFRRTSEGWRIVHRYEEASWRQNAPDGLLADPAEVRGAWARQGGAPAGPCASEGFPQPLRWYGLTPPAVSGPPPIHRYVSP